MANIGNKEKNFKRYLENHFEIFLPPGTQIFYTKGVRIGNNQILKSNIDGELGYAACDFGFNPTNAIIQNFGYLAKKNVIELDQNQAKEFANGKHIPCNLGKSKSKHLIIKYHEHVIGLGHYDKKKKLIINKIPEKRRRGVINEID